MLASRTHGLLPNPAFYGTAVHPGIGLACWLGVSFLAALVGNLVPENVGAFYQQLVQPAWAPPRAVFGPVWAVLYALMGISAWLVWRDRGFAGAGPALGIFLMQIAANAMWTWLFFGLKAGALAFGEILLLWVLVLMTTVRFAGVSRTAAALMLPYLAWMSFAALLSHSLWRLNPGVLSG